jgi:oligoendopeptidase F
MCSGIMSAHLYQVESSSPCNKGDTNENMKEWPKKLFKPVSLYSYAGQRASTPEYTRMPHVVQGNEPAFYVYSYAPCLCLAATYFSNVQLSLVFFYGEQVSA